MCDHIIKTTRESEYGECRKRFCGQRVWMSVLAVSVIVCVLCGCTRREQLILDVEGTTETAREADDSGQSAAQDSGTEDGGGSEEQSPAQNTTGDAAGTAGLTGTAAAGQEISGQTPADDGASEGQQSQVAEASVICVHVCGAVKNAGVYELPGDSRVFEAVKAAGGFTEEADESYVNQAQRLSDGAKLVIPTMEQVRRASEDGTDGTEQIGIVEQYAAGQADGYGVSAGSGGGSGETASASDGKVNINTASEAQLCEIPGIGATRAAAIVAYRQESGGFKSIEDIMNVSGIKEGTYAKIKDSIKVN